MAKCYVNDKEIPCGIFWAQYGWFLAIPFILIGLLLSIKPDWILKFQVWWMKILGSKWEPGKVIPKIYRGMGIIFLILGLIFLYLTIFHYHAYPGPPAQINPNNPPSSGECGVANCHGLDIECGEPVQMCTAMYQLGDKCREFAKCGKVNGKCQQIENSEFTSCKSCALKCEKDFPNDAEKALDCESMC
jgi:hypothetical protein